MPAQIKNGIVYQGGSPVISVTKAELEQMIADDTYSKSALYKVKDESYDPDANQIIDDNSTATDKAWSANKLNTEFSTINSTLERSQVVNISTDANGVTSNIGTALINSGVQSFSEITKIVCETNGIATSLYMYSNSYYANAYNPYNFALYKSTPLKLKVYYKP